MKAVFGILFALLFCLPAVAQDKPQLPKDIPALKALAEKGNAEAQASLGEAYRFGLGVKRRITRKPLNGGVKRQFKGIHTDNSTLDQ